MFHFAFLRQMYLLANFCNILFTVMEISTIAGKFCLFLEYPVTTFPYQKL